jgi:hypothetical protein
MKTMTKIIIGILFAVGTANANSSSYPTIWHIENTTSQTVDVSCSGKALGGARPIELSKVTVKSGENSERVWGEERYNDGLGVQAANWECKAGPHDAAMVKVSAFSTDWGQNMELSISQGANGLIMKSLNSRLDVAKASAGKGENDKATK